MPNKQEDQKAKEPYEKPMMRVIELAAEEVLAIGCKTVPMPAVGGGPPCSLVNCALLGS